MNVVSFFIVALQKNVQDFRASDEQREYLYRKIVKQIVEERERNFQIDKSKGEWKCTV